MSRETKALESDPSCSIRCAEMIAANDQWAIDEEGEGFFRLVFEAPNGVVDPLRVVVELELSSIHGSWTEYRMYKAAPIGQEKWEVTRSDTAESWGLDGTTGELKCEKATVSPAMTYAYAAVLEMCDRSGDWRDVVVQLCWLCTLEGEYYLKTPDWIARLSPTAGMALVRFLDELLRERAAHEEATVVIAEVGTVLTGLLKRYRDDDNPNILAVLLEEKGAVCAWTRQLIAQLEEVGKILAKCSPWCFPGNHIFSSPAAQRELKALVEPNGQQ